MKSPLHKVEATSTEEDEQQSESAADASVTHQRRNEKDSGYSDSSSESISSEEPPRLIAASGPEDTQHAVQAQVAYTPVYIVQNVVLKQPRIILLQAPLSRHHKQPSSESYLPILRSYPKIAPRIAPPPPSPPNSSAEGPAPPACKPASPTLLEVSLRSLALLRRTRETQRSIRELRAHAILYQRALHGEEGGWERLQRAMERSGGYRDRLPLPGTDGGTLQEEPMASSVTERDDPVTTATATSVPGENFMASSGNGDTQTEEVMSSENSVMSSEAVTPEGEEDGNV